LKRLSLGIDGTTLNVPVLSNPIRISAIGVPNSGAAAIEVLLLDGIGQAAARLNSSAAATGVFFAVQVGGDGAGNLLANIPPDFILNTTETLQINASAAIVSPVIFSYEDLTE